MSAALASRHENEARRAASLRRVAIILQGLPNEVAEKLLSSLDSAANQRLRNEVASLVDVDPMERRRALESFTGSMRLQASRDDSAPSSPLRGGENTQRFDPPQAFSTPRAGFRTSEPFSSSAPQDTASSSGPSLDCLGQISDKQLMSLLMHEHPQTQAVVLSSIPPRRAASLLPMLPVTQRQDMLSRIGRLRELPAEMFAEIAGSFQEKVEKLQAEQQNAPNGGNPLQALIDAYAPSEGWDPAQAKTHVPASAAAVSPRLQAILSEMPTPSSAPAPVDNAAETAIRLRTLAESSSTEKPKEVEPLGTDEVHQELVGMSSKKLCETLGRVSTRVAILTLCGLPNETADAAINELPRSQANQVRSQLMNVGSMEIRDIDRAKEEVVRASRVIGSTAQPSASGAPSTSRKIAA